MNFVFELNHPKHYHQFKHIIKQLKIKHKVIIIAREKEVLFRLLEENNMSFVKFKHTRSSSVFIKAFYHLFSAFKLLYIVRKHKTSFFITKASISTVFVKIFQPSCKTIIFPDSEVVWLTNNIVIHFANHIFTPENFLKKFGKKQIRVPGVFENSYLSPYQNNIKQVELASKGFNINKQTVFLRFVSWSASHDINNKGFSFEQKIELVKLFDENNFNIIISSEGDLPPMLACYRNPFPPSKIHSLLKTCNYYVGDSQTMATESSLLGLKTFRYNSFVGEKDMSNFRYLESIGLLKNFNVFNDLITSIKDEINRPISSFYPIQEYWEKAGDQNKYIMDKLSKINKHI